MKLSVERNPGSIVVLDITADDAEFAEAVNAAVRKVSKDVQIPGFRKGKAPRAIIERNYGRDVFVREAADDIMEKLYREALKQEDLTPVGDPDVEIKDFEPINFVVTVAVYPKLELGDYSGVRVDPIDAAVTDAEIDDVIERLQRTQSPWVDPKEARPAQDGDQVTVDYEVNEGETAFQEPITDAAFVLGETNLLTQFRENLTGLNVGDSVEFDIEFAEDDTTTDASIRGKTLSYKVTVTGIKERDILPIDDEFAKTVADAETIEDLKQQIRDDIHQGKTNDGRTNVLNQIIEKIGEVSTLDLPEAMIHEELHHQLDHLKQDLTRNGTPFEAYLASQGQTESTLHDSLWPEAERRLRSSMLMQEVAKAEAIEVTDEDLDAEVDKLISVNPSAAVGEEAEANVARLREIYKSDYFRNMLSNELFERKLTDRLIELATEGRGAVINAYVAPEPTPIVDEDGAIEVEGELTATEAAEEAADQTFAEAAGEVVTAESAEDAAGAFGVDHELTATEAAEDAADETFAEAAGEATPTESAEEAAEVLAAAPAAKKSGKKLGPAEGEGSAWIAGDGKNDAPAEFPIKGNASSKIYHTSESPFYEATIAEVYFATPEDAEAAGYRLPKALQGAAAVDATKSAAEDAIDAVKGE